MYLYLVFINLYWIKIWGMYCCVYGCKDIDWSFTCWLLPNGSLLVVAGQVFFPIYVTPTHHYTVSNTTGRHTYIFIFNSAPPVKTPKSFYTYYVLAAKVFFTCACSALLMHGYISSCIFQTRFIYLFLLFTYLVWF